MALEYVGGAVTEWAGSTSTSGAMSLTALTGGIDTQARAGDLVIAAYSANSTANITLSISDGTDPYTLIASELYANSTYDTNLRVAYKFMGPTPDASVTFGPSGSSTRHVVTAIHVWRGADPSTPLDVAATTATATSRNEPDPPSITPVTTGAVVIAIGAGASAGSPAIYTSSLSNFLAMASTPSGTKSTLGIGSTPWTSGALDPDQFGGGDALFDNSSAALTLALRPAPPSGSASITFDPIVLSATGFFVIEGESAIALDPIGLASTGMLPVEGAASITLGSVTLAAAGFDAISVNADAAITFSPIGLAASGALPIAGALDIGLGALALQAALKPVIIARPPRERTITFGSPTIYIPSDYAFLPYFNEAEPWAEETPADYIAWSEVVVSISGLGGGDAIALECSLDAETWFPLFGLARVDLAFVTAIATDGVYQFSAGAWLRWSQTGNASNPVVLIAAGPWFGTEAMVPPGPRGLAFPAARAAGRFLTLRD